MKNKQVILILFLLFNIQILKSQITFQKSYDAQFHERIITSCATADGNYLLGGELDVVNKIFICKINPYGDIIWSKKYYHNTTETLTKIIETDNGNIIVLGKTTFLGGIKKNFLLKTDHLGRIIWSKTYGDENNIRTNDLIKTSDSCFILLNPRKIIKFNELGDIIWNVKPDFGGGLTSLTLTNNNKICIIGNRAESKQDVNDLIVLFISQDGQLQNKKYYILDSYCFFSKKVIMLPDGVIMHGEILNSNDHTTEYNFFLKTDNQGNTIWFKKQDNSCLTYNDRFNITRFKNKFYAGAYINSHNAPAIFKMSENGDVEWANIYGNGNIINYLHDITIATQELLVSGRENNTGNAYVIRMDTNGASGCNQTPINITMSNLDITTKNLNGSLVNVTGTMENIPFFQADITFKEFTYCESIPPSPPIIQPDFSIKKTFKNCPYQISFSIDDINLPNDSLLPLNVLSGNEPKHGHININTDTSLTYYPDIQFTGNDSFSVCVCDTTGLCDTAKILMNVVEHQIHLGNDTVLCNYDELILNAGLEFDSYQWQDGSTEQTYIVDVPGIYHVKVFTGSCSVSDTIAVDYEYILPVNLGQDTSICEKDSIKLNAGAGYEFYQWHDGTESNNDSVFVADTVGWHWVNVSKGVCQINDSIYIEYDTIPVIMLGNDTILCNYQSLTLNPGTGYDKYLWHDNSSGHSFVVTTEDTCHVTVTNGACKGRDTIVIFYDTIVPVNLGQDTILCDGDSVKLNAGARYEFYQWHDGTESNNDSVFVADTVGWHWVNVSKGVCQINDSIYIEYDTIPVIMLGNDTILCNYQSLTLNPGTGYDKYLWHDNSSGHSFVVTTEDTCHVTVTNGACKGRDTIVIFYDTIVPVNLGQDTILCDGDSVKLNAGAGYDLYLWHNGTESDNDSVFVADTVGWYWVNVSKGVCQINDSIYIKYDTIPDIMLGNDTILCNYQSLTLNPGTGYDKYLWHDNSSGHSFVVTTEDTCHVTVTNGACKGRDTIVIFYDTIVPVNLGHDTALCDGDSMQLNAGYGYDYYKWKNGIEGVNDSMIIIYHPGKYNVVATKNICHTSDTIEIIGKTLPQTLIICDTFLCEKDTNAIKAYGGESYLWSTQDTSSTIYTSPNITKKYYVSVYNTCGYTKNSVTINVQPLPVAKAGSDKTLMPGQKTTLSASGGSNYLWSPITHLSCYNCKTPEAFPVNTTTYYVTVTDEHGCSNIDSIIVNISPIIIPNAFSPNGDGVNDTWTIKNIENFPDNKIEIFNRWGKRCYYKKNYTNDWSGSFNNNPLPDGVYYYIVKIENKTFKGSVNIIR